MDLVGPSGATNAIALGVDFLLPVDVGSISIGLRRVGYRAETLLNTAAKLRRLGAQFVIGELLHLRLERVDSQHARLQALDLALVLSPENLTQQSVNQNGNPSKDTRPTYQ